MDSNELMLVGLLLLAALSVAAIVFLLINPYLSGEHRTDKRIQGVTENRAKQIAIKTLKELEDRQKAREKLSLRLRLQRAGLDIQPRVFWLASLVCGVVLGAAIWLTAPNLPIVVPLLALFVGTLGLPRWILARTTKAAPIQVHRRAGQCRRRHRARRQVGIVAQRVPCHHRARIAQRACLRPRRCATS